jgi:hypothetical protein
MQNAAAPYPAKIQFGRLQWLINFLSVVAYNLLVVRYIPVLYVLQYARTKHCAKIRPTLWESRNRYWFYLLCNLGRQNIAAIVLSTLCRSKKRRCLYPPAICVDKTWQLKYSQNFAGTKFGTVCIPCNLRRQNITAKILPTLLQAQKSMLLVSPANSRRQNVTA